MQIQIVFQGLIQMRNASVWTLLYDPQKTNYLPGDLGMLYGTSFNLLFNLFQSFAGHPPNLDVSVMTFQPIQGIQAFKLPPVEETRSLAY